MSAPFAYLGEQAYSRLKNMEPSQGGMNSGVVTTLTRVRSFPDDVTLYTMPRRKLSRPEVRRLYDNSPEMHEDVKSFAAFLRIVHLLEKVHGVRDDEDTE